MLWCIGGWDNVPSADAPFIVSAAVMNLKSDVISACPESYQIAVI
jgi:hypothetical protein